MSMLYDLARQQLGDDVILFTTDGRSDRMIECGSPDQRYLTTIDFGATDQSPEEAFSILAKHRNHTPWVNSEFYIGWFDSWGAKRSHVAAERAVSSLKKLLSSVKVSLNLYMFHGGTNYGFWNGQTDGGVVTTTYDFDSPLSEAGDMTEKFIRLQEAIFETSHILLGRTEGMVYKSPVNMELLRQYEGFTIYSTLLPKNNEGAFNLTLTRHADVAHIYYADDKMTSLVFLKRLFNGTLTAELPKPPEERYNSLVILEENVGYINFGPMWNDIKGLIGTVTLNGEEIGDWKVSAVNNPFDIASEISNLSLSVQGSLWTGQLIIRNWTDLLDTFIQMDTFEQGLISINDVNLGHYNQKLGPQLRLYVPKCILQVGVNNVTVLEMRNVESQNVSVSFHSEMLWSHPQLRPCNGHKY